jgi:thiosulfate/3-mercaptopyruvate sulfurtransferase
MASTPLISTADLATRLSDGNLRIVDCRFDLADAQAGRRAYDESRLPRARYVDLNRDLSDLSQAHLHGRHPLPDMVSLSASLARLDITRHTPVVAYDQDSGAYASRLWWLLRATGHTQVKVLNGGLTGWKSAGLALESGPAPPYPPSRLPQRLALQKDEWLDADSVARGLSGGSLVLLDARGAARFRGDIEPIDPIAGHVPGAENRPFQNNLTSDGDFKEPAQLRAEFTQLLRGRPATQVVHMCGSGVTACHNRLAMDVAGLRGSRLYPDSWSGWITDSGRPVAVGA